MAEIVSSFGINLLTVVYWNSNVIIYCYVFNQGILFNSKYPDCDVGDDMYKIGNG